MAGKSGGSAPTIKKELFGRPFEFSFFQVIRLLKLIRRNELAERGENSKSFEEYPIKVRPELSLGFPSSDVSNIKLSEDGKSSYKVTATFLGLYGTSSPLPTFYTEDLLAEAAEDESVTRDFLDILNHHIYDLLYECWAKYRLYVTVVEERDASHTERLFCLLGLGESELRSDIPSNYGLLRYLGLVTQRPRSAMGLRTLLTDALGGIPVNIEPCTPRHAPIPESQRACLGNSGTKLGENVFLGREILDRMGKFRVVMGPLTRQALQELLPGTQKHQLLVFLTNFYLSSPLEWDLKLLIHGDQLEPVRLGDPEWARLGWTTWLFSGEFIEETNIILQPQTS